MTIDEKRARLLDAAGQEFASKGFEGATVRAICERAGANLAAIHYHFGDKERLYEEVVLHAHRSGPKVDPAILSSASPREALGLFIGGFVQHVFAEPQHSWQQAIMFREMAQPTRASDTLVREAIRPSFEILLGILRQLTHGLDEQRVVAVGLSIIGQCLHYRLCGPMTERIVGRELYAQFGPDYLTDHITRFSLAALGQGEPFTRPDFIEADVSLRSPTDDRGER